MFYIDNTQPKSQHNFISALTAVGLGVYITLPHLPVITRIQYPGTERNLKNKELVAN